MAITRFLPSVVLESNGSLRLCTRKFTSLIHIVEMSYGSITNWLTVVQCLVHSRCPINEHWTNEWASEWVYCQPCWGRGLGEVIWGWDCHFKDGTERGSRTQQDKGKHRKWKPKVGVQSGKWWAALGSTTERFRRVRIGKTPLHLVLGLKRGATAGEKLKWNPICKGLKE